MLNGLLIALGIGGGWACVRLLRGRAVAWLGIPVLALLFAGGAWALSSRIVVPSALTPLLSLSLLACGGGAGLGAAVHSDWNTRRQLGLSLALLVLSAEGALLLAWLQPTMALCPVLTFSLPTNLSPPGLPPSSTTTACHCCSFRSKARQDRRDQEVIPKQPCHQAL